MRYWVAAGLALVMSYGQQIELVAAQTSTLDTVKGRGQLQCGVSTGLAGFGAPNDAGQWQGLDVDICRAVSAAVFKNVDKIKSKGQDLGGERNVDYNFWTIRNRNWTFIGNFTQRLGGNRC